MNDEVGWGCREREYGEGGHDTDSMVHKELGWRISIQFIYLLQQARIQIVREEYDYLPSLHYALFIPSLRSIVPLFPFFHPSKP